MGLAAFHNDINTLNVKLGPSLFCRILWDKYLLFNKMPPQPLVHMNTD